MSHPIEDLQRISVKFPLAAGCEPELGGVIPVFHRWIQDRAVDGMLIDVADYAHVPQGPGVMLIAHEGNYAIDLDRGRFGVLYARKQPLEGDLEQRLAAVCSAALRAAELLAGEGEQFRIAGDQIEIAANDRLLAPNDGATDSAFRPVLDRLLDRLFDGSDRELCRDEDPRERFNLHVKASSGADAATLRQRLT